MTYQQGANDFILLHGLEKAKRIADSKHQFYSDKTGSYYATDKNESVSIKHLKKAVKEYKQIVHIEKTLNNLSNSFRGLLNDKPRNQR